MDDIKMNVPEEEQPVVYEDYEFGDLYVKCKCGNEDLVASGLEGGIRIDLYTTNSHTLNVTCSKCGASLSLGFKEAKDLFKLKEIKAEKKRLETAQMLQDLEAQITEELIGNGDELQVTGDEGGGSSFTEEPEVHNVVSEE